MVCQQVSCTPVSCVNPSFIDGQCCPVCLGEFGLVCDSDPVWKTWNKITTFQCVVSVFKDDDDGWSPWSEWTECSATCGRGGQQRGRSCNDIPSCAGPSVQTRGCMLTKCDRKGTASVCKSDLSHDCERSWLNGILYIPHRENLNTNGF